jgi:ATP-dependent helicase YprA (DUF1998 family)
VSKPYTLHLVAQQEMRTLIPRPEAPTHILFNRTTVTKSALNPDSGTPWRLFFLCRLAALNGFKAGTHPMLIATDVASRGLDIPSVDLVVNFEIPRNSKDYIHRVGRTARAGRSGQSVTFVTQYDVELFQRIEDLIGKKMDLVRCLLDLGSNGQILKPTP